MLPGSRAGQADGALRQAQDRVWVPVGAGMTAGRGSGDRLSCPFDTAQDRDLLDFGMGMILEGSREHCRLLPGSRAGQADGATRQAQDRVWVPAGAGMTAGHGSGDCLNCDLFDFGMGMISGVSQEHCRFLPGLRAGQADGALRQGQDRVWITVGAGKTAGRGSGDRLNCPFDTAQDRD